MQLVAGVRWSFRGKDAGSPNALLHWGDGGRGLGASSAARRHRLYFAKPSYSAAGSVTGAWHAKRSQT